MHHMDGFSFVSLRWRKINTHTTCSFFAAKDKQPVAQPPLQEPAVAPEKVPQAQTAPPGAPPRPREEPPPVEVPPQPLTEPCAVISMTHQQVHAS